MIPLDSASLKSKLDNMTWSFTRISAYAECPYKFYLTYILHEQESENAFSQWGSLMHELLAQNAGGTLELNKLVPSYKRRFKRAINLPFPPSFNGVDMRRRYYNDGLGYFFYYSGIPERYEVLDVEHKLRFKLGEYDFIGFLDLLLRDRESGDIVLIDHKSKRGFKSRREQRDYARQLYLYAHWVEREYGRPPKTLAFNMLRLCDKVVIPYDPAAQAEALNWARDTIQAAHRDSEFLSKLEINARRRGLDAQYARPDYFCQNICGQRKRCAAYKESVGA